MSEPVAVPAPAPIPVEQLQFAMPPVHASPDEERTYRRERLAGALRLFGQLGYEDGVSGHISARDPELADCFWVNPFGAPFADIAPQDLILVNGDGQVLRGRFHVNQAAFAVHAAVHRARPDTVAVAHTHSTHGRALAALGEPIEPITQESCAFYEDHALYDAYSGVVVDEDEGRMDRRRARAAQGGDPAQPRAADRRRLGGRGGLVVPHHGARLPGAAAGAGRREARAHLAPGRRHHPRPPRRRPGGLDQLPAPVAADLSNILTVPARRPPRCGRCPPGTAQFADIASELAVPGRERA